MKEDGVSLKEKLNKQIVVTKNEDEEEDLSNDESILKFINKHSKYGKIVRELEFFQETLSHKIYKIVGSEEEIVIKVPKKLDEIDQKKVGLLDLVFETQLAQLLQETPEKNAFFSQI